MPLSGIFLFIPRNNANWSLKQMNVSCPIVGQNSLPRSSSLRDVMALLCMHLKRFQIRPVASF